MTFRSTSLSRPIPDFRALTLCAGICSYIFGFAVPAAAASTVVINEVFPATGSANKWVELYNPTDNSIDMSSWRLKRGSTTFGTVFGTGTTLAAHSFTLREATTSLPLDAAGSPLQLLAGSSGPVIDSIVWPALTGGQSYARTTDGGDTWAIAITPTKNISNAPPSDTTPPVAALTAPAAGTTFGSNTSAAITATVSDDHPATAVLNIRNAANQLLYTETNTSGGAALSFSWNTGSQPSGSYNLSVTATDAGGLASAAAAVNITIDATAPAVAISPISGPQSGTVTPVVTIDGQTIANPTYTYHWTADAGNSGPAIFTTDSFAPAFTPLLSGPYTFFLTVADQYGNSTGPLPFSFQWQAASADAETTSIPPITAAPEPVSHIIVAIAALVSHPATTSPAAHAVEPATAPAVLGASSDTSTPTTSAPRPAAAAAVPQKEIVTATASSFAWYWLAAPLLVLVSLYLYRRQKD